MGEMQNPTAGEKQTEIASTKPAGQRGCTKRTIAPQAQIADVCTKVPNSTKSQNGTIAQY